MARRKNGLGWIKPLPDGRFRMRMRVGVNDNGVPKILTVTGRTEAECIRKMRKKSDPYVNGIAGKGFRVVRYSGRPYREYTFRLP